MAILYDYFMVALLVDYALSYVNVPTLIACALGLACAGTAILGMCRR